MAMMNTATAGLAFEIASRKGMSDMAGLRICTTLPNLEHPRKDYLDRLTFTIRAVLLKNCVITCG